MSALLIVILVLAIVLLVGIVGGLVVTGRRRDAERAELHQRTQDADRALALAQAEDRGWERSTMEAVVRRTFAERSPAEPVELLLLQVLDRPGTDDDEAVFRVVTEAGAEDVRLVRRAGDWVAA